MILEPGTRVRVKASHGFEPFRGDLGTIDVLVPIGKYHVTLDRNGRQCVDSSDLETLASVASKANAVSERSRYGRHAPPVRAHSSLETLCAWLQWCDPNGCHTAELAEIEDIDPYTLETAWDAIIEMCEDT